MAAPGVEIEALEPTERLEQARPPSSLRSGLAGAAQGMSLGFADEMAAGLQSLGSDQTYQELRDQYRDANAELEAANPYSYLGGELAGGLATGSLAVGGAIPQTLRGMAAQGARQGAGFGAAAGAGYSTGETAGEVAEDAAVSGLFGGALGGVAAPAVGAAGRGLGRLGDAWLERANLLRLKRAGGGARLSQMREFENLPPPRTAAGPIGGRTNAERIAVEIGEMQTPASPQSPQGAPVFGRAGLASDEAIEENLTSVLGQAREAFEDVFDQTSERVDVLPILGEIARLRSRFINPDTGRPTPNSRRFLNHLQSQRREFEQHAQSGMPLRQAQDSIDLLRSRINWAQDPRSLQAARDLNRSISSVARQGMDDAVERSPLGQEGREAYQSARRAYQILKTLEGQRNYNALRGAGNRQVSFSDYQAGTAGGLPGAAANRAFRANEARLFGEAQRLLSRPMRAAGRRASQAGARAGATAAATRDAGEGAADAFSRPGTPSPEGGGDGLPPMYDPYMGGEAGDLEAFGFDDVEDLDEEVMDYDEYVEEYEDN